MKNEALKENESNARRFMAAAANVSRVQTAKFIIQWPFTRLILFYQFRSQRHCGDFLSRHWEIASASRSSGERRQSMQITFARSGEQYGERARRGNSNRLRPKVWAQTCL